MLRAWDNQQRSLCNSTTKRTSHIWMCKFRIDGHYERSVLLSCMCFFSPSFSLSISIINLYEEQSENLHHHPDKYVCIIHYSWCIIESAFTSWKWTTNSNKFSCGMKIRENGTFCNKEIEREKKKVKKMQRWKCSHDIGFSCEISIRFTWFVKRARTAYKMQS